MFATFVQQRWILLHLIPAVLPTPAFVTLCASPTPCQHDIPAVFLNIPIKYPVVQSGLRATTWQHGNSVSTGLLTREEQGLLRAGPLIGA
jgi:hypothetical protein